MYHISDEQVDYILNDLGRRGIETEDLQLNLLDHICIIIEQELEENGDFEHFYGAVVKRFYKNELCEIEEETTALLTFKNYYTMKKLMMAAGIYSVATFITGSFFKIMHWPGSGALLVSAILVFSLVFLPVVFLLKTRERSAMRDKIMMGCATLIGVMYCLSSLFLLMRWQGSREIWLITLSLSFFVLIPLYFINGVRRAETKVNTIVTTIIMIGILGVEFTLTALHNRAPLPKKANTASAVVTTIISK